MFSNTKENRSFWSITIFTKHNYYNICPFVNEDISLWYRQSIPTYSIPTHPSYPLQTPQMYLLSVIKIPIHFTLNYYYVIGNESSIIEYSRVKVITMFWIFDRIISKLRMWPFWAAARDYVESILTVTEKVNVADISLNLYNLTQWLKSSTIQLRGCYCIALNEIRIKIMC